MRAEGRSIRSIAVAMKVPRATIARRATLWRTVRRGGEGDCDRAASNAKHREVACPLFLIRGNQEARAARGSLGPMKPGGALQSWGPGGPPSVPGHPGIPGNPFGPRGPVGPGGPQSPSGPTGLEAPAVLPVHPNHPPGALGCLSNSQENVNAAHDQLVRYGKRPVVENRSVEAPCRGSPLQTPRYRRRLMPAIPERHIVAASRTPSLARESPKTPNPPLYSRHTRRCRGSLLP